MKPFIEQAQFYAAYHRKQTTLYTHLIGVPLIIFSLMVLLGFIQIIIPGVFATNFASLATLAILIYYYRLNWKLSLALTPWMLILLWLASWFSHAGPTKLGLSIFFISFILGWTFQLYGHYAEGKKPALMDNLSQSLIAPLYLVAEIFFMAGFMKTLKEQIDVEYPE